MNGRLENELIKRNAIKNKIVTLPPIFTEFYAYMEEDDKSYGTIEHYIDYVVEFMNYITNGEYNEEFYTNVSSSQIRQFIASQRTKVINGELVRIGDSIIATKWSAIKRFFIFLIECEFIDYNPMSSSKRPKVKNVNEVTFLNETEIKCLLNNVKNKANNKLVNRDIAIISLFLATGLRKSALAQINIDDIDFVNNTIKVIEKGRKVRTVGFGANMHELLQKWIVDRNKYFNTSETDALFLSQWNNRISTKAIEVLLAKYIEGVTDKHITVHKLRATAATQMGAHDIPVQVIKEILGHENINTTMRYVAALNEQKQCAVNVMDSLV